MGNDKLHHLSAHVKGHHMSVDQQVLQGNWNEIKGKIHKRWGQISDDELQSARGSVEQLVGVIQRKTGTAREEVMKYLEQLTGEDNSADTVVTKATHAIKDSARQTAEVVQERTRQAMGSVQAGYEEAEQMVQRHPGTSMAVCFASGLLTGLLVAMTMRR